MSNPQNFSRIKPPSFSINSSYTVPTTFGNLIVTTTEEISEVTAESQGSTSLPSDRRRPIFRAEIGTGTNTSSPHNQFSKYSTVNEARKPSTKNQQLEGYSKCSLQTPTSVLDLERDPWFSDVEHYKYENPKEFRPKMKIKLKEGTDVQKQSKPEGCKCGIVASENADNRLNPETNENSNLNNIQESIEQPDRYKNETKDNTGGTKQTSEKDTKDVGIQTDAICEINSRPRDNDNVREEDMSGDVIHKNTMEDATEKRGNEEQSNNRSADITEGKNNDDNTETVGSDGKNGTETKSEDDLKSSEIEKNQINSNVKDMTVTDETRYKTEEEMIKEVKNDEVTNKNENDSKDEVKETRKPAMNDDRITSSSAAENKNNTSEGSNESVKKDTKIEKSEIEKVNKDVSNEIKNDEGPPGNRTKINQENNHNNAEAINNKTSKSESVAQAENTTQGLQKNKEVADGTKDIDTKNSPDGKKDKKSKEEVENDKKKNKGNSDFTVGFATIEQSITFSTIRDRVEKSIFKLLCKKNDKIDTILSAKVSEYVQEFFDSHSEMIINPEKGMNSSFIRNSKYDNISCKASTKGNCSYTKVMRKNSENDDTNRGLIQSLRLPPEMQHEVIQSWMRSTTEKNNVQMLRNQVTEFDSDPTEFVVNQLHLHTVIYSILQGLVEDVVEIIRNQEEGQNSSQTQIVVHIIHYLLDLIFQDKNR